MLGPFLALLLLLLVEGKVPPNYQKICGFSEVPIDGDEGQILSPLFRLRGISLIFRHGQRFDIIRIPEALEENPKSCEPFLQIDKDRFSQFERTVTSEEFTSFLDLPSSKLGKFTTCPDKSQCGTGQLLPEGALQLEKLGHFMRNRYLKLLNSKTQVTIGTTNYNRTVQSAIAFSNGFLYPRRNHLSELTFIISDNDMLCFDDECSCPYAQKLWAKEQEEMRETFHEMADPKTFKLWTKARKIPIFTECYDPQRVLDTALTRFVCRRRNLPCKGEACLSYGDLDQIRNFTSNRGIYWYNQGDRFMRSSIDHLRAYNFLRLFFSENQQNTPFIQIFSAHDVVLGGILHSMGVSFSDPPRYASRILIEIYENEEKKDYFRLLYNGLDLTRSLDFCQKLEEGLCSLEDLKELYHKLSDLSEKMREKCHDE